MAKIGSGVFTPLPPPGFAPNWRYGGIGAARIWPSCPSIVREQGTSSPPKSIQLRDRRERPSRLRYPRSRQSWVFDQDRCYGLRLLKSHGIDAFAMSQIPRILCNIFSSVSNDLPLTADKSARHGRDTKRLRRHSPAEAQRLRPTCGRPVNGSTGRLLPLPDNTAAGSRDRGSHFSLGYARGLRLRAAISAKRGCAQSCVLTFSTSSG
jgi:hypothetical protein